MKVTSKLAHRFTIENEDGDQYEVTMRPDDMVQMGFIGKAIKAYDSIETQEVGDEIDTLLAQLDDIKEKLTDTNKYLDLAFGDFTAKLFKGSYSITMYEALFEGLTKHMDITERKTKEYVDKRRRATLQDHKPKDTL